MKLPLPSTPVGRALTRMLEQGRVRTAAVSGGGDRFSGTSNAAVVCVMSHEAFGELWVRLEADNHVTTKYAELNHMFTEFAQSQPAPPDVFVRRVVVSRSLWRRPATTLVDDTSH